jgi:hypothetical protein
MATVKRGKALVAQLRAQAGVRDPEALAAYLGRFKKARKAGMSVAKAKAAAKGGGGQSRGPRAEYGTMPKHSEGATKRLEAFEKEHRNKSTESGLLISPDGEILAEPKGDDNKVRWDAATRLYDMPGAILTHNHPKDLPFSEEDIQMMNDKTLKEIRVVTPTRRHSMTWDDERYKGTAQYDEVVPPIIAEEKEQYRKDYEAGRVTPAEGTRRFYENTWRRAASKMHMKYASERL